MANSIRHNVYSKALTEEDKQVWNDIEVGNVDNELKIARLQLQRALTAKAQFDAEQLELPTMQIDQETTEHGQKTKSIRKHPDYHGIIYSLLGRIGSLERIRAELISAYRVEDPNVIAEEFYTVIKQIRHNDNTNYGTLDDDADSEVASPTSASDPDSL